MLTISLFLAGAVAIGLIVYMIQQLSKKPQTEQSGGQGSRSFPRDEVEDYKERMARRSRETSSERQVRAAYDDFIKKERAGNSGPYAAKKGGKKKKDYGKKKRYEEDDSFADHLVAATVLSDVNQRNWEDESRADHQYDHQRSTQTGGGQFGGAGSGGSWGGEDSSSDYGSSSDFDSSDSF